MNCSIFRKNNLIICITILCCSLLTGCPSLKLAPLRPEQKTFKHIDFSKRQQNLQKIQQWHLSGALAITYYDPEKKQRTTQMSNYEWTQKQPNKQFSIVLKATQIGLFYTINVSGDQHHAQLQQGKKKYNSNNVDDLMAQVGFPFPVSYSYYWIRGIPAPTHTFIQDRATPAATDQKFDQWGHLIACKQGQWTMEFMKYEHDPHHNMDFPRFIKLEWHNPDPEKQNTNILIRIAIKKRQMSQ